MRLQPLMALAGLALPLLASGAPHCVAMADADSGAWLVHEGDCGLRQPPMSTFKIAISLMGYDSGILRDAHTPKLPFKAGYVDWNPGWRQATDPAAWMRNSVVWYSQQVTAMLGAPRFDAYVQRFGYGNGDVSGDPGKHNGLSNAWLASSLRISADEQVAFLRRVVQRELGLAPQAYTETEALLRLPETVEGWQVHGKTGSGSPVLANGASDDARRLGWYVGWLSKGQRRVVFAQMAVDERTNGGLAGLRVKEAFLRALPERLSELRFPVGAETSSAGTGAGSLRQPGAALPATSLPGPSR